MPEIFLNEKHYDPLRKYYRNLTLYDPVSYSGVDVMQVDYHKHLGFILDSKMSYSRHIDGKIGKANPGIGVIKRLYNYLPR